MKNYKQFTTKKEKYEAIRDYLVKVVDNINESSFQYYYNNDFNKDYEKVIAKLEKKGIDINQFFKEFRTEIYKDFEMTAYCGLMDAILYKFDNNYWLSGLPMNRDADGEAGIKYKYGYHSCDLGRKYLLQSYDTFEEFYEEAAPQFAEDLATNEKHVLEPNYAITTDIDKTCQLILIPDNILNWNVMSRLVKKEQMKQENHLNISPDGNLIIIIVLLGEISEKKKLIDKIYDKWVLYRTGKQLEEIIVNFTEIKDEIWLKENVKKYNL